MLDVPDIWGFIFIIIIFIFFFSWLHFLTCRISIPRSGIEPRAAAVKIPSGNPTRELLGFIFLSFFFFFFNVDHFKSLYWICYYIASVVCVLAFWPRGIRDPSSPTRDQTHTPCIGRWSPHHWLPGKSPPLLIYFKLVFKIIK